MNNTRNERLDILAFGAHPDDVEIGMGGTLFKQRKKGLNIGICDLTYAELSSNGTVEQRQAEAKKAAEILDVNERIQLDFPDRGIEIKQEQLSPVIDVIRRYQPSVVFAPYYVDRHPDHGQCARLVKEAVFNAGIRNWKSPKGYASHRVTRLYYYLINGVHQPDFVCDISEEMSQKRQALQAYRSQFVKTEQAVETPLTNGYIETVEARERLYGKEVGVQYAEGFFSDHPILKEEIVEGLS